MLPKAISYGSHRYRLGATLAAIRWNYETYQRLMKDPALLAAQKEEMQQRFKDLISEIDTAGSLEAVLIRRAFNRLLSDVK